METFVVGHLKDDPSTLWGFINVASDVLFEGFGNEAQFRRRFPNVEVFRSEYRDAGTHQLRLQATETQGLARMIADASIRAGLKIAFSTDGPLQKNDPWRIRDARRAAGILG